MTYTHQTDREIARLKSEAEAADKRARDRITALETRCTNLEAFETYFRDDFYPWAVAFQIAAGVGDPPPEPPP